jgi:hypothetical protein
MNFNPYEQVESPADARVFAKTVRSHWVALVQEGFTEDEAFRIIRDLFAANRGGE